MKTRRHPAAKRNPRSGLAPLELVLYLPIMLFVMALMINFGNMAAWKVRTQHNTRYAAWRTLQDRTGQRDPHPRSWPQQAELQTSGGDALTDVNTLWNRDQHLVTPVARGPVIVEPAQGRSIVVPGRFNMPQRVLAGRGRVRRRLPLLRGILPDDGTYGYTQRQELLDNRWEYRHLSMPRNPFDRRNVPGDSGNRRRRAKRWYRLDPAFFPELQGDVQRLVLANARLKRNPTRFNLDPLDRDPEFFFYRLRARLGFPGTDIPPVIPENTEIRVPDFHPRARQLCNINVPSHQTGSVQPMVQRIQRLPGRMAQAFMGLYEREIARLQQMVPPPQGEIDNLQQKLQQMERFRDSLPRQYR